MDGVEVPESDIEEEGAVGGEEEDDENTHFFESENRKIVGRSRRKMKQQVARKVEVPVELHIPREQELGVQSRGNVGPRSPRGPGDLSPSGSSPYEDLDRRSRNEHAYEGTRFGPRSPHNPASQDPRSPGLQSQRSPQGRDPNYEEMNMKRQYNRQPSPHNVSPQQGLYGAGSPKTPTPLELPRTPGSQLSQNSPYKSPSAESPRSAPRTPVTPGQYQGDDRYNMGRNNDKYNTPHSGDKYNTEYVNTSKQTYLTDDADDGGFSSQRTTRSPPANDRYGNDTNYNRQTEPDRYGNSGYNKGAYNPSDRYNSAVNLDQNGPRSNMAAPPRDNHVQNGKPVATPRGFHRQQGSGRSDTSTSDSGFGEIDSQPSKVRSNSHHKSAYGNTGIPSEGKTPYYNRAFEHDPAEQDISVNDIMAKHKALAAHMYQNNSVSNGNSNFNPTDRYNSHTQQSPRWQDQSMGSRDVTVSRSRLQSDSQQVEESFI